MDPNIGKTTGRERTVTQCKESLTTSCGPHRKRFLEVQTEIRVLMTSDGQTFLPEMENYSGDSKPIEGLDETILTNLYNVFMIRWSDFHDPVHSAAFAMDRQFCRRDMDVGVQKDIWSVMEDFVRIRGTRI